MTKAQDITGFKSGKLTVLSLSDERDKYGRPLWKCVCDCQRCKPEDEWEYTYVRYHDLICGSKKSCGCLRKDVNAEYKKKRKNLYVKQGKMHIGETSVNASGYEMILVDYISSTDVIVEFQDEYKARVHAHYHNFTKGHVKNPYEKILFGKGYEGVGEYEQHRDNKPTKEYEVWTKMLTRCYSKKYHQLHPTYIGCEVCDEWLNFQNFAKWYKEHEYFLDGENTQLDKDWLVYGNKIYSPETCVIAPNIINKCLLDHCRKDKNSTLPKGLCVMSNGKFQANVSMYSKAKTVGTFEKVEDAMKAYLDAKVGYIKELADKYKEYIPDNLYEAMYDYKTRFLLDNPEYNKIVMEA